MSESELRKSRGRPRKEDREGEGRKKRVGLGLQRNNRLSAYEPPGYHGHWINDEGSRIQDALAGDYQFMLGKEPVGSGAENRDSDLGQYTSQIVGTKEDGSPLRAYWMVIKKEWYEEDQREKQRPVDEIERAIKGGTLQPNGEDIDTSNQYVPRSGIHIS